jgi:pimeloyl-ACP methyl ester carboxylesterase
MLGQTRAVLEKYAASGGSYQEVVIEDAGHLPFIEKPEEFNKAFHVHIT